MKFNLYLIKWFPATGTGKVLIMLLLIMGSLQSCRQGDARTEDQKIADETNTAEWLAYGRTHSEQRFSPLTDIDTGTVGNLAVDW
jgi:quinohemoprotein ethanol dehydrogenase